MQYNRIVTQRNKLLKDMAFRPDYEETLDVWDMQLVQYGKEMIGYRKEFIKQLDGIIGSIHGKLSGEKEHLRILYEPNVEADEFEDAIRRSRQQDMKQKTTLTGPHRMI